MKIIYLKKNSGKLKFAKKLTEWAVKNEKVEIVNISDREKIKGVKNINVDVLLNLRTNFKFLFSL